MADFFTRLTPAERVISYPHVARILAARSGLDYNTVTLPLVERVVKGPFPAGRDYNGVTLAGVGLIASDGLITFRSINGRVWVVDTSEPCPSCGGSAHVPAWHPDSCHHLWDDILPDGGLERVRAHTLNQLMEGQDR